MKFIKLFVFFATIAILFCHCESNSRQNPVDYLEIPFVLENHRIVIEATINGKEGRFIFDTGATESYLDINVRNLRRAGKVKTKYNGLQEAVNYYHLNQINFGGTTLYTKSIVINRSDFLTRRQREGYDGLLGSRTFEGYWVELSFSKEKIILHKEKPEYFTKSSPVKILFGKTIMHFYIPVKVDGETFLFVLDTGEPFGIYFPAGATRSKNTGLLRTVISNEPDTPSYYLMKTDTVIILDEEYSDKFVMTNSWISVREDEIYKNLGVLGIDFLRYYNFLFDYRNLLKGKTTSVYYEPNTPVLERNYGHNNFISEIPELGILDGYFTDDGFIINRIIEDSIAYKDFGLRPEMLITKINGNPMSEFSVDELMEPLFYQKVTSYSYELDGAEQTLGMLSSPVGY